MPRDFYAILALPRNATEEQIRQRFRELARQRHPDRFQGEAKVRAEGEFQEITQAFNVLADPERRRNHDLELTRPEPGATGADPRQLARVYLQRGIRAYKEKNHFEAADSFSRATHADPGNAQAWHHLALACSQQASWLSRAVEAIERACLLAPMNAAYQKLAGKIAVLAGQPEAAERHYRAALEWGDDDPAVRQALTEIAELSKSPRRGLFGKAS
ncbi:MAG TPA: DnaJ domain-containing protein [Thermoanaerobaculia bacterium]|jgi:tetratricopeptide (TPR) repeat protein|nr:DnaJ domain-containing protein [Thermoanaerobaculia bacterium]